jgi:hypothetical protein
MKDAGSMDYRIDWIDRDTIAYRSRGLTVFVWVDFERGLFSRGRVLHTDSIKWWVDSESNDVRAVTEIERDAILSAIQLHYARERRSCRLEP